MKRLLIDMDGTLYRGEQPIAQAKAFLTRVQTQNVPFVLLTNCPLHSPVLLQKKLARMGMFVDADQIITSGSVCASYIACHFHEKKVFVIGSESFEEQIAQSGAQLCTGDEPYADAVAVGYAQRLDYAQMCHAVRFLRQGAAFLATNGDATIPSGGEMIPHTGAVVSYLETAVERKAYVFGKPFSPMLEAALSKLDCNKEDCIVIGDGLKTDFAFAVQNDLDYRIVLSGVATREAALSQGVSLNKICNTLEDLDLDLLGEGEAK